MNKPCARLLGGIYEKDGGISREQNCEHCPDLRYRPHDDFFEGGRGMKPYSAFNDDRIPLLPEIAIPPVTTTSHFDGFQRVSTL